MQTKTIKAQDANNSMKRSLVEAKRRMIRESHSMALRSTLAQHPSVRAVLMLLPPALRHSASVDMSMYTNSVRMYVSIRDLASFKDKALTSLLSKFAGDEWKTQPSSAWAIGDKPNVDYRFTRRIPWDTHKLHRTAAYKWLDIHAPYEIPQSFEIELTICAYVKGDSDMCRIEVKGVKEEVVTREVRVIRCGDTEMPLL